MYEIKGYIVMLVGAVFSLLAPIQNFMYAMVTLFSVNFLFGLLADRAAGEKWQTKKALWFFAHCAVFFVTACALFVIGYLMGETKESVAVVKIMCYMAVYVFTVNILRNWKKVVPYGGAWWKLVDLLYYVLSVKFIERFQFIKQWQAERAAELEKEQQK